MECYTVSSRLQAVAPRARWRRTPTAAACTDSMIDVTTTELIGRPLDVVWAERMARMRERFTQTTFFLFDANSWR